MSTRPDERVWERARSRQHVVALGFVPGAAPAALSLVRTSCDVPPTTLGPIAEVQRKVARILDQQSALLEQARDRVVAGVRRRLLGDVPPSGPEATLVALCNRLARHDSPYALVFEAVDAADDTTCDTLRRVLERPGWLELPVVLVVRNAEALRPGPARLVDSVRATYGAEAVVAGPPPAVPLPGGEPAPFNWYTLPADVVQVLRAGAVIGSGFEAELVALLLDRPVLAVLDGLQRAADAGAPIEDRGEGRFFLPESLLAGLQQSLLPSLAAAWHRRLGAIFTDSADRGEDEADAAEPEWAEVEWEAERAEAEREATKRLATARAEAELEAAERAESNAARAAQAEAERAEIERMMRALASQDAGREAEGADTGQAAGAEGLPGFAADVFAADPDSAPHGAPAGEPRVAANDESPAPEPRAEARAPEARAPEVHAPEPRVAEPPARTPQRDPDGARYRDEARAGSHLSAAGQAEAAAERYAAALTEAAARGSYQQAMAHGRRALALIEELPGSPARRHFRIRLLCALARLQWQAAGSSGGPPDPTFTLESALGTADAALASLRDGDPAVLIAQVRQLVAGVCYDIGDLRSLERALDELTRAARLLLEHGEPTAAARLLNDQAAVYVRLGDPVRATHLLTQSEAVFQAKADDPVALEELAETHHLIARLPLHARIRPGREADAFAMALERAALAEQSYRTLGNARELARVWETMGRLELLRGRLEQAARRLSAALEAQARSGDLVGLARSTAAFSEVLAHGGKYRDALGVLADSVALNREKGSPIGLAFNRRALEGLAGALQGELARDSALARAVAALERELGAAEAALGRVTLPGA